MTATTLASTAHALVASDNGILAADESFPTIEKRFKAFDIPSTEENRRAYRELLFATPGLREFVSGVILFDETIRQKTGGASMPKALAGIGIIPGVKVDGAATERLNAICTVGGAPWTLTFSFGRALQDAALKIWKGSPANVAAAQAALLHRAKCNGLAVQGKYSEQAESENPVREKHHP